MKINYRPEIDGLRAIAVISVIIYHAEIKFNNTEILKGGFLGVDIFFVISGYLISLLIFKELITTGKFLFSNFYERRIRRIIPTLLLVMLFSLPIAWIVLTPYALIEISESIISSLGFISNIYFYYSGIDYDAFEGLFIPFLHTWSLSVEEQFYILFPITIIFIYKFFRKYLLLFLVVFFILSFFMHLTMSKEFPSLTFYFLHTRIWELIAGSILAYLEVKFGCRSRNKVLNSFLPIIGLILISFSILFFDSNIFNPSILILLTIIGTCILIWFSNDNNLVKKILSHKLFVSIGLISYSLYLWHYPIFSFAKSSGIVSGSFEKKLIMAFLLFVLSVTSYFLVEKPFRNKKFNYRKIIFLLLFFSSILLILNLIIIKKNGFPHRFDNLSLVNKNYDIDNFKLAKNKISKKVTEKNSFTKDKINVLIIGDSHGSDTLNIFTSNNELFSSYDFIHTSIFDPKNLVNNDLFLNSDIVLLSFRWSKKDVSYILNNLIPFLKKYGKKVIISSNSNEYKVFSKIYTLIDNIVLFSDKKIDYFGHKKLYFNNRVIHSESKINVLLKNFSKKNELKFFNKEDYLCDIIKGECDYLTTDGHKIFYDYGHYTKNGAKYFGKKVHEMNLFQFTVD